MYKQIREMGSISISKNVIGNIVSVAAEEFGGRVIICNSKGKIPSSGYKVSNLMEITMDEGDFNVKIYVLIRFGSSIALTTDMFIDSINLQLLKIMGFSPDSISVVIKGTFSKNVAKRNIEVKR